MPRQLPLIDDDIYDYLVSRAVPLEDDINSLLRRLLELPSGTTPRAAKPVVRDSATKTTSRRPSRRKASKPVARTRAPKGSVLHELEYQIPILRSIEELGGRAPSSEVIDRVGKLLDDRLGEVDREALSSGEARWRNRAQFVRLSLIKSGDMKSESPRGVWEISDQGRGRLAEGR